MKGLLIVSFLAAFMSTIDTHLNWGASYLVHDIYARFIKSEADPRHYVRVSQFATLLLMVLAVLMAERMQSISAAWEFLLSMGAGAGAILLMRWFWWRLNAWSEIAAMGSSIGISLGLELLAVWQHQGDNAALFESSPIILGLECPYHLKILIIVPLSLLITLAVTYLTKPEPEETLRTFYQRVGPGGWWKAEHTQGCPHLVVTRGLLGKLISGTAFLVGGLFSLGYLFLGFYFKGIVALFFALITILAVPGVIER